MWERLQSLQSHCADRKATQRYEEDRVTVAQFVRRFFNLKDFEEEEILRICGILQVRHSYTKKSPVLTSIRTAEHEVIIELDD